MSIGLFDQCQTKVWKVFSCDATLDAHTSVCTSLRMCKLAIHSPISSEKQYLNSTLDSLDFGHFRQFGHFGHFGYFGRFGHFRQFGHFVRYGHFGHLGH